MLISAAVAQAMGMHVTPRCKSHPVSHRLDLREVTAVLRLSVFGVEFQYASPGIES